MTKRKDISDFKQGYMVKETEFNLSEMETTEPDKGDEYYSKESIKEFIKTEKELLELLQHNMICWGEFWDKRNKLAGDKLVNQEKEK